MDDKAGEKVKDEGDVERKGEEKGRQRNIQR